MVQQLLIQSHNFVLQHLLIIHPAHMSALKLLLLMESIPNSSIVHRQSNIIILPLTHAR
jgi:hypothetical protein